MNTKQSWAVMYFDYGPSGPCGQSMETTRNHSRIVLVDTEDEAFELAGTFSYRGGKRAEVRVVYPHEIEDRRKRGAE